MRADVTIGRVLLALLVLACWPALGSAAEDPPQRIVAVGDVHGSPDELRAILERAELVDGKGEWVGGSAVLVQTGDLLDRGTEVRALLDFMRGLERSASENGGRLVALLGNHEVFNLAGFFDYESTPLEAFAEISADFSDDRSERTRQRAYKKWSAWSQRYPACGTMTRDDWMTHHPLGFIEYQEALSARGEYGRWLRERRVVARVGGTLFLHGGLSPELVDMGLSSVHEINTRAAEELRQFDKDRETLQRERVALPFSTLGEIHCAMTYEAVVEPERALSAEAAARRRRLQKIYARLPNTGGWLLMDGRGPVWFRGYAEWTDEEAEVALATVFETFGGSRVVVGHTPQIGNILARFGGRVFLIDTAMAYADVSEGRAAALELLGEEAFAIYEGERISLSLPEPAAVPTGNKGKGQGTTGEGTGSRSEEEIPESVEGTNGHDGDGSDGVATQEPEALVTERDAGLGWLAEDGSSLPFSDENALLEFLETARVVEWKTLGKGITRPKRLVLEQGGVRARAIFHDIHEIRTRHRTATGEMLLYFRDSYENNVAAYELSRLMGITSVPPTTIRRVDHQEGSVQLWIENAYDEAERRKRNTGLRLPVPVRRSIADMWVFDNLINNTDRNQGNMLFDPVGRFWWIDHSRSFARSSQLVDPGRVRRCSRSLYAALPALDQDRVQEVLGEYLHKSEIRSLFARRDKLIDLLDEKIDALGEESVLFAHDDPEDTVTVIDEELDIPESVEDEG